MSCRPGVEPLEARDTPTVSFGLPQGLATGQLPDAVAVADFNGDGKPDYAVVNTNSSSVSVFVNTTPAGAGTPAFAAAQNFAAGALPESLVAADVNGDGRPDLAVTNYNAGTVTVLLNTTAPGAAVLTFGAAMTFNCGAGPKTVAAGDFTGDGRPDLVVTNYAAGTVSVLTNTTPAGAGTPSFAAPQTFAVGGLPADVAVADFNGDGRPDLATANFLNNTVSVLLNTTAPGAGKPSFAAQKTFVVGSEPQGLVAGDFNGDGRPDLAAVNLGSGTVSVLVNTTATGAAAPAFAGQQTFATGNGASAAAVADFSGDGRPDLAVTDKSGNAVVIFENTTPANSGTISFAAPQNFGGGNGPQAVRAGDFNSDGRADLVVCDLTDNTASVLRNTTTPFACTGPVVVGQFGTQGVKEYNRAAGAWVQLTAANATQLAADAGGDVVGEFPGSGVWEYRPAAGWQQLNGVDASLLALDGNGDVAAEFPGYGVGEYLPAAGWRSLTAANATLLATDAGGDVVGEYPGNGIWEFRPATGWQQLNGVDATLLAVDAAGDVAANFKGYGVGEYRPAGGWQSLNGVPATALAFDGNGDLAANFAGYGVGEYLPAVGWRSLTGAVAAALGPDALGHVFGAFGGAGVWEFDPASGWFQLSGENATLLVVA